MPAALPETDRLHSLSLAPSGHLHFKGGSDFGQPLPARLAERLEDAFARGTGHGLLHLAAEAPAEAVGPLFAFWRELGKHFLTRLCGLLDLDDAVRDGLDLELENGEIEQLLAAAPPMQGIEYLGEETLRAAWGELQAAFVAEARASGKPAGAFLAARNPLWTTVGRVWLHIAENRARSERPFAFLATYTARLSSAGRLQHVPLGQAVKEQAAAANRDALRSLLVPVRNAAEEAAFLRELLESRRIFQPQAWRPEEAHRFLREAPIYETHGLHVRVPDWWNPRSPPRLRVAVTVGSAAAAGLGADALLDFSVGLSLDGEAISEDERREILAGAGGLALVKGRWVEVDSDKLADLLSHWKKAERMARREGVSFHEGMRLLARLPGGGEAAGLNRASVADPASGWLSVEAGDWLHGLLESLKAPRGKLSLGPEFRATLRKYQEEGVEWLRLLHRLRLGGCLADDMGLGKTLQVLALLAILKQETPPAERRPSLLVLPASLIGNWKAECARFVPELRIFIVHPSELGKTPAAAPPELLGCDLAITTYGMLSRQPWMREIDWRLVVLDEAQAIKNPGARQSQEVKALRSEHRLALTGTPIENRLSDLWSLFDFLHPGLLGSAREFSRLVSGKETPARMPPGVDEEQETAAPYAAVRSLVRPYLLRRLKSDKRIIADLPDKQEVKVYCGLRKVQAVLYEQAVAELERSLREVEGMRRRGTILAFLMRFKQICNHPSQWTGDGGYDAEESGKMARLRELCEEIAERQEKVLVFTQFREISEALAGLLGRSFGRGGLVLTGETAVKKRREIVDAFQDEGGPPFLVLSLKAGGTGLNLTAASHVIHFDRWWNPAVEDQATDRAYRIGQKRSVLVHKFICRGTVEERIDTLLEAKKALSGEILKESGEAVLTEMSNEELMRLVALDKSKAAEAV
jgi:superfamily II DNA or RNA helicase